jgi:hypothetical protein
MAAITTGTVETYLERPSSAANAGSLSDVGSNETLLVNPAFLQEIKDSNPPLWRATDEMSAVCDLGQEDLEHPQQTIKRFVGSLDHLRDLLALQFSLEESFGYLKVPTAMAYDKQSFRELAASMGTALHVRQAIEQHRRLYLELIELVETAEELQYRGCQANCLAKFALRVTKLLFDLNSHERLEADLIARKKG